MRKSFWTSSTSCSSDDVVFLLQKVFFLLLHGFLLFFFLFFWVRRFICFSILKNYFFFCFCCPLLLLHTERKSSESGARKKGETFIATKEAKAASYLYFFLFDSFRIFKLTLFDLICSNCAVRLSAHGCDLRFCVLWVMRVHWGSVSKSFGFFTEFSSSFSLLLVRFFVLVGIFGCQDFFFFPSLSFDTSHSPLESVFFFYLHYYYYCLYFVVFYFRFFLSSDCWRCLQLNTLPHFQRLVSYIEALSCLVKLALFLLSFFS